LIFNSSKLTVDSQPPVMRKLKSGVLSRDAAGHQQDQHNL